MCRNSNIELKGTSELWNVELSRVDCTAMLLVSELVYAAKISVYGVKSNKEIYLYIADYLTK